MLLPVLREVFSGADYLRAIHATCIPDFTLQPYLEPAPSYLLDMPAGSILIGSDNGFIVEHTSPSTDTVVYANTHHNHTAYACTVYSLSPSPVDAQQVFAAVNLANPLTSIDGGNTWLEHLSTPLPGQFRAFVPRDPVGGLYLSRTSPAEVMKSIDNGVTWTTIISGAGTANTVFPDDRGFLWNVPHPGLIWTLKRTALDGTGSVSFGNESFDPEKLYGFLGIEKLYTTGGGSFYAYIDISSPGSPTITEYHVISSTYGGILDQVGITYMPTSPTDVVLHLAKTTVGEIFKSGDNGNTWSQKISHADLAHTPSLRSFFNSIVTDPSTGDLWAVGKPPGIFHSTDAGDTWTRETINMAVFDPFLSGPDVRPTEWLSLCMAGTPTPAGHSFVFGSVV